MNYAIRFAPPGEPGSVDQRGRRCGERSDRACCSWENRGNLWVRVWRNVRHDCYFQRNSGPLIYSTPLSTGRNRTVRVDGHDGGGRGIESGTGLVAIQPARRRIGARDIHVEPDRCRSGRCCESGRNHQFGGKSGRHRQLHFALCDGRGPDFTSGPGRKVGDRSPSPAIAEGERDDRRSAPRWCSMQAALRAK